MNCPKCKGFHLKPKKLERGLSAPACDNCKGSLLPVIQYLQWPLPAHVDLKNEENNVTNIHDTKNALQCPKCAGLMTKYKISIVKNNKLDICIRCYEVWIDAGEWQLLKQLHIHDKLPDIFTSAWQKNIRIEIDQQSHENRSETYFGEDYKKIRIFKDWLETSGKKNEALSYLSSD